MTKKESKKEEARLKLIITAKELARISVEKAKIRLELVVTARELAKAVIENKKNRIRLVKIAKHLARVARQKENNKFKLRLNVKEFNKITAEKEKIKLELFTTTRELANAVIEKETQTKYYEIFANALDGIFVADPVTRKIVDCNKAAEKLTGYSRRELLSMKADQLHPKDREEESMNVFKKQAKGKEKKAVELELLTNDGRRVPVSVSATPVRIGDRLYMQGTFRDVSEQKKAKQLVLENKKILEEAESVANLGSYVLDIKTGNWTSSKELDEIFGIDKKYAHSVRGWSNLIYYSDRKMMLDYFSNEVLGKHKSFDREYRIIRKKNKEVRWVHGKGRLDFDHETAPIRMYGTIQDINKKKESEEALLKSNSLFHSTVESTTDGILVISLAGKVTFSNKRFQDLWEVPSKIIISGNDQKMLAFVLKRLSNSKEFLDKVSYLYAHPKEKSHDIFSFKNGKILERYSVPQRIGGKIVGRVWNFRDITKNKTVETKLVESEVKFRTMFENAAVGISLVGLNGKWLAVNPALGKITGYSMQELLALDYMKLTVPEDIEKSKNSYSILLAGGHDFVSFDKRYVHKNGYIIWVNLSISLVRDQGGKPLYFIVVTENITEKKKLEKAKAQFVALTSHQLRTPPTAINWYSEMLLNNEAGTLNEKQIKYVKEIHTGNQRMINLINSFLNVSQLQLGTIQVRPAETCIAKVTNSVLEEMQVSVNFKKLNITKKYDDTTPHLFKTDPGLIRVIIQNLISNAVSYTSSNGEISILIDTSQPHKLHLEVTDNGCGIPEEAKPKIFSEFFRADNAKSLKGDGSGLGLYITKSIISLLGGEISFESKEGKGTTFFIDIPGRGIVKNDKNIKLLK